MYTICSSSNCKYLIYIYRLSTILYGIVYMYINIEIVIVCCHILLTRHQPPATRPTNPQTINSVFWGDFTHSLQTKLFHFNYLCCCRNRQPKPRIYYNNQSLSEAKFVTRVCCTLHGPWSWVRQTETIPERDNTPGIQMPDAIFRWTQASTTATEQSITSP